MFVRSLVLGVSALALSVGAAQAADLIIPTTPQPIIATASGFDWEGMYAGVRVGGQFFDGATTFGGIPATTGDVTRGVIGAAVGVNFIPMDPVLVGVEVTGDYVWGDGAVDTGEFFANLRAGAVITDNAMIYALAGVGIQTGDGVGSDNGLYQLGAGVEFAVTDAITVRGEVVGQGDFNETGANDRFFEAAKATVGVFYHF